MQTNVSTLDDLLYAIRGAMHIAERAIGREPTGEQRNRMTDINIGLMQQEEATKALQRDYKVPTPR